MTSLRWPSAFAILLTHLAPLTLLALTPTRSQAVDLRVGYIDSGRIFQEFKQAQEAQQRFDRVVQGWRDEASDKENAVKKLRTEVRDQSPILSAAKRQEKEDELQRAVAEYERFVQEVWGPQGKASQENERVTQEVVTKIRAAVEKVAGNHGLTLVLDAASGFIIYADKSMDFTNQVLQELNALPGSTSTGTR
jgi:outer membrane protein